METVQIGPRDVIAARNEYEKLLSAYIAASGVSRVVVRHDIAGGAAITYTSAGDYVIESRQAIDGRIVFFLRGDDVCAQYSSAGDIPKKYRTARSIAHRVELIDAAALISAHARFCCAGVLA